MQLNRGLLLIQEAVVLLIKARQSSDQLNYLNNGLNRAVLLKADMQTLLLRVRLSKIKLKRQVSRQDRLQIIEQAL